MKKLLLALALFFAMITPASAQSSTKYLEIHNHRAVFPIMWIYIVASGEPNWGPDQLGGEALGAGESRRWYIEWPGCYVDMKAVTFTGLVAVQRGVNICKGFVWDIYD